MKKKKVLLIILVVAILIIPTFRFIMNFVDYPKINTKRSWVMKDIYKDKYWRDFRARYGEWVKGFAEYYDKERKSLFKFNMDNAREFMDATNKQVIQILEIAEEYEEVEFLYIAPGEKKMTELALEVAEAHNRILEAPLLKQENKEMRLNAIRGIEKYDIGEINRRKREIRKRKAEFAKEVQYFLDFLK